MSGSRPTASSWSATIPALNSDITRGADGAWLRAGGPLIRDLPLAALAAYDVGRIRPGTPYAAQFPDQSPADGARMPTLEAVLHLDGAVRLAIEMKTTPPRPGRTVSGPAMADAVAAAADAYGAAHRILVQSFDFRGLRHLRRTRPDIALAWLTCASTVDAAPLWWDVDHTGPHRGSVPRAVAAEGGSAWGPDHAGLTEDLVAEAHGLGLAVVPWTVNRLEDMQRLITWGVDGLITDRPDLARRILAAQGIELPPPRRPVPAAETASGKVRAG